MKSMEWIGVILVIFAILTSFGITFGFLPLLGSGLTVLVAIAGTYLWVDGRHGRHHG